MSEINVGSFSSHYLIDGSLHISMRPQDKAAQVAGMAKRGLAVHAD